VFDEYDDEVQEAEAAEVAGPSGTDADKDVRPDHLRHSSKQQHALGEWLEGGLGQAGG
jgi:hypothetical protein